MIFAVSVFVCLTFGLFRSRVKVLRKVSGVLLRRAAVEQYSREVYKDKRHQRPRSRGGGELSPTIFPKK